MTGKEQREEIARQQRIRRKQVLLGMAVYLSALIPLGYIDRLGMLHLDADLKIFGVIAAVLTSAAFYVLIRTGLNLHFSDPSMTFAQVMAANGWSLVVAWVVAQPARPLAMVWYLLAFLFGFYTLKRSQFLALMLFALAGYALIVVREYYAGGPQAFRIEMLHWLILATGLFWMSLVGSYVSMLRRRLAEQRRELAEVAFIDPLTRVYNRRYLLDVLQRELARLRRETVNHLSIALIDVDAFKALNDRHGHVTGDRVLQRVAELIHDELRNMDAVGRYGGEEFVVVMPDTPEDGARICMERVRRRIGSDDSPYRGVAVNVTVSIGVAEARSNDDLVSLIDRADRALYAAKEAGRDRVVPASNLKPGKVRVLNPPGNHN